jgi:hypothetical protein
VILLAQQLLPSWTESPGTWAAFVDSLASLVCCVSLWLQRWCGMKEKSGGVGLWLCRRRSGVLRDVLNDRFMAR